MPVRVATGSGTVEGMVSADRRIAIFKGIPYAAAPLGALRWRRPQRAPHWSGVRPAREFGSACVQPVLPDKAMFYSGVRDTTEDCLYLNIYTGGLGRAEKRPVLVWLHYGGFLFGWSGASLYDGEALAREGVVVVTLNYRLGRFGFLAHPALSAESSIGSSGNYGIQDQIAALGWVRDNIGEFGGDPDCVTLYGVSAGSYSVSVLMSSPLAKGLFHRAIAGSGAAFGPLADSTEGGDCCQTLAGAERVGLDLMNDLGANTAEEMRGLSAADVLCASPTNFAAARPGILDSTYPIIDGMVLVEEPYRTFARQGQNDVPLITGSNSHEGGLSTSNSAIFIADSRAFLGPDYDRFAALYPAGSEALTTRSSKTASADRLFSWQNWAWANAQAESGTQPVFYYHFAHAPPVPPDTFLEQAADSELGAYHTAELYYSLRNLPCRQWAWTEVDYAMSDTLSGYWLQFMRTGNPNRSPLPHWAAFQQTDPTMMRFAGAESRSVCAPDVALIERLAFWQHVYSTKGACECRSPAISTKA